MSNNEQNEEKEAIESFWLSLDKEGLELLRKTKGDASVQQDMDLIRIETNRELLITKHIAGKETCPESLMETVYKNIKQNQREKSRQIVINFLTLKWLGSKERKILVPVIAILIFAITVSLLTYCYIITSKINDRDLRNTTMTKESIVPSNIKEEKDPFENIVLASLEENFKNLDIDSIQQWINSRTPTISMNIDGIQNSSEDYQILGYREDPFENGYIIQLIFKHNDSQLKVIISPCTQKGIDIYKPAIVKGKLRDIRLVNNFLLGLLGEPGVPVNILNYFENISESSMGNNTAENPQTIENNVYEQNDLSSSPLPIVGNDANETNSSSEIYDPTNVSSDVDSSI